jgi:hypothetical protein
MNKMGNIKIYSEDDRLDTQLGRIPIRVHKSRYHFDCQQLIKMIEIGLKKKLNNVSDYDLIYNISNGNLEINFYINPNIKIVESIDYKGFIKTCISLIGNSKPNNIVVNIYNEIVSYGF